MMLKTVYGPPPADMERIDADDLEMENGIQEEDETVDASPAEYKRKKRKGAEGQ